MNGGCHPGKGNARRAQSKQEKCGTNTGAEVKNTSWANAFFPAGKRTPKLEPSTCFHVETGAGTASRQQPGEDVVDSYGSRDEVFLRSPAQPGGSSDSRGSPAPSHVSPLPCQPPRAHPSCTFFTHLLRRLYLGSELPRHGSALEKPHREICSPPRLKQTEKDLK